MVVIIKKGENVNHEDFDDVKKNLLDKGENVNHAYLDDLEKKSLDCHHQKGGECECMNT